MFHMLESGFSSFVDVASKIATVGTFIWAVLTLKGQRTAARESEAERLEEKIIGLLSSKEFKIHRSSARVLIHYLDLINLYSDSQALKITRPIVEEYFSAIKISDLLDIEDSLENLSGYQATIDCVERSYENLQGNSRLDARLAQGLIPGINVVINPPEQCIDLWQIVDLLSFALNRDRSIVASVLESQLSALTDPHHRFPALFAYYNFYNGTPNISLKSDGTLTVSRLILDQPREQ